jgi:hypothetical protein
MTELYIQRISTEKGDMDVVQRSVLVLKQALHYGLGAALITSLLEANKTVLGWVIPSVIDIIHDMLSSKYQDVRDEACRILGCLTRPTQRETHWTADSLLSQFLFDGSLLRADYLQIEEIVRSTGVFSPRCLSQEEILTHWHQISSCLVLVVRCGFKDGDADLAVGPHLLFSTGFSLMYFCRPPPSPCGSPSYLPKLSRFGEIVNQAPPPILVCSCLP